MRGDDETKGDVRNCPNRKNEIQESQSGKAILLLVTRVAEAEVVAEAPGSGLFSWKRKRKQ